MLYKKTLLFLYITLHFTAIKAQKIDTTKNIDTIKVLADTMVRNLPYRFLPVIVEGIDSRNTILRLEPIVGTFIYSGKKNEVIELNQMDASVTEKTGRQLFAKIPGLFVYDMEGGNQMNIATRGLDPHRGWEFNLRKDGILINSDLYAYPASHYSIPMESVKKIELARGTSSLQYGAQFGGMLNYVSKQGDTSKIINFENYNTIGSFNLVSTYYAIGGKYKKISYYAYVSKRTRDGYRDMEHTDYNAEGVIIGYEPNKRFSLRFEYARSSYVFRLAGPLTDAQFYENPQQATRARNYFNPTINIPSLTLKWDINSATKLQLVSSALLGLRNSVLFDKAASIKDSINLRTMQYNNRQVDIDHFNSYTQELRILHSYQLGYHKSTLVTGLQLLNNNLHRTQMGKGTTGSNFDLTLVDPIWGRDIQFKTLHTAIFAENNFKVTKKLALNIGARMEMGRSSMSGKIIYYPENKIPLTVYHKFPLFGSSFSFKLNKHTEIYGGISQAYRPMIFKDMVPASIFEKVNQNLKDAYGYNAEFGARGCYKFLHWDLTGFMLRENNRFGTVAMTDSNQTFYTYRTNIGNSLTKGIELFIQGNFSFNKKVQLVIFTSTSFMDGRYIFGHVNSGNINKDIKGHKIESVPTIISRNGLTVQQSKYSMTLQYSYTEKSYADALNTEYTNATGTVGITPAYGIFDLNMSFKFSKAIEIKSGINNLLNKQYFTKRPLFYPGPGIWSSDGRSASISVIFKL